MTTNSKDINEKTPIPNVEARAKFIKLYKDT